jgi:hypothetical protein
VRQFARDGRVVRLTPGFKTLLVAQGKAGRPLEAVETLTFMSNGEREEAIDARATGLLREGWEEVGAPKAKVHAPAKRTAPEPDLTPLQKKSLAALKRSTTKSDDAKALDRAIAGYRALEANPRRMKKFLSDDVITAAALPKSRRDALLGLLAEA